MSWQKLHVAPGERVRVSRDGRPIAVLDPGDYRLWRGSGSEFEIEPAPDEEPAEALQ